MHGATEQTSTLGAAMAEGPLGPPMLGEELPGILMRNCCLMRQIRQKEGAMATGTPW